ncbi:MAG: nitrogenase component 1 [Maledivibacter sp.]|jgi:nitrogenase molybdenum-iron protein alpha/beta subunit|nr:nitrogenase component 1 [Maledivibacter sp.]
MRQKYYEELSISMYPAALLHRFGVNGKVSGSIYAVGEMKGVIPIIHGPRGCGYHYRYSARRRNYPYYDVISSEMEEREIIFGGEEKLYETIIKTHELYSPKLIVVIPTPISDVIHDDIVSAVKRARDKGINVIDIKSELFSHRDKSYSAKRFKEVAKQKFGQSKNLDFDIKGCGFTEMLYAIVEDIMVKTEVIPLTVNIETIGFGPHGKQVLREVEDTLGLVNVRINTYFPSTSYEKVVTMSSASLNIVRRLRWAKNMKEKFGTPYLQINTTGRYSGIKGISEFYRDIGIQLGIEDAMENLIKIKEKNALDRVLLFKEKISAYRVMIISSNIQSVPYLIKKYAVDYGMNIIACTVILTEKTKKNLDIDDGVLSNLKNKIGSAINECSKTTELLINPTHKEVKKISRRCDVIVGTDDYSFHELGLPIVHPRHDTMSLSYESYISSVEKMYGKLKTSANKPNLILNKLEYDRESYPLLSKGNIIATEKMWSKMWLHRKGK